MEVQTSPTIDIQITLSGAEAERLSTVAVRHGISTADLVRRAIDTLVTSMTPDEADWQNLSLTTFEADWDNVEDAVYDDWRKHYGVDAR